MAEFTEADMQQNEHIMDVEARVAQVEKEWAEYKTRMAHDNLKKRVEDIETLVAAIDHILANHLVETMNAATLKNEN